jgi:ribose 5-phosphate isomerase B
MIVIGSDHGGFELKEALKAYLEGKGKKVLDCGTYSTDSVDYPDIAKDVCCKVLSGEGEFAILVCGTGIGISIAANKIKGIRAALLCNTYSARATKEHNDANVICFGGRVTTPEVAIEMLDAYMNAKFQGGRHQTRIDKLMEL